MTKEGQTAWIVGAILIVGLVITLVIANRPAPKPETTTPIYFPQATQPAYTYSPPVAPEPTSEVSCRLSGGAWVPTDAWPYGVCVGY